jgi:NAD+ kinase
VARVFFVVHPERPEAASLAARAQRHLESLGHQAVVPEGPPSEPPLGFDLLVSLGGDGTMLRTLELANAADIPVLGVNLGHLGYLTEVDADGLPTALQRFTEGAYEIEERMTLEVTVARPGGEDVPWRLAINEAVVEKRESGHTIRVAVSIGGRSFLTYSADGMIVATPTGSTAYNLSARGPIASPRLRAILVTPVSPHMLFDRPLVLEPSQWLHLEVTDGRPAVAILDGYHVERLEPGDALVCRAGSHPARLITLHERDFHSILRAKFGLEGR